MALKQLELEVPAAQLARAEALLNLLGATSIALLPAGRDEILEPEPGTTPVWRMTRVRALFPATEDVERVTALLSQSLGGRVAIHTASVPDAAWIGALAPEPRELDVGSRLLICGATGTAPSDDRVIVRLNRGLGFGTGEHATTRLCLEWLDANLMAGASVVDYGCGSGILAVAALRLGASFAWAVDIEPQALQATSDNAELNNVDDRLWIGHPDALRAEDVDVVLANILATPLIALAPRLARLVSPQGTVVMAGLLGEQSDCVGDAYSRYFELLSRRDDHPWACLIASRRKP